MTFSFNLGNNFRWLLDTVIFLRRHFAVIITLGLIAAFGRVIQLGGFGAISSWTNIVLEVIVESTRILLFLYVLGMASIRDGVLRIKRFFIHKENRRLHVSMAIDKLKKQWLPILLNITGFLMIAFAINYLIDLLAYETCLYLSLKKDGILSASASEWTVLLFFKNLSVIPFTLAFEAGFLLWITNKFQNQTQSRFRNS